MCMWSTNALWAQSFRLSHVFNHTAHLTTKALLLFHPLGIAYVLPSTRCCPCGPSIPPTWSKPTLDSEVTTLQREQVFLVVSCCLLLCLVLNPTVYWDELLCCPFSFWGLSRASPALGWIYENSPSLLLLLFRLGSLLVDCVTSFAFSFSQSSALAWQNFVYQSGFWSRYVVWSDSHHTF